MDITQFTLTNIGKNGIFSIQLMNAKVAELADALDLGSSAARCGGSSPPFRINT